MKLWTRIKTWPIWAVLAGAGAMLGFLWLGGKARRFEAAADEHEELAARQAAEGSHAALESAKNHVNQANEHRRRAEAVKELQAARLDKVGESNETVAVVVDRWNRNRLRDRTR